mmetsp:Transcript_55468/g.135904  ORF Transcript_55468/g.135904 Transcript_55468/m.135904 type:complete len:111 (+) Transcript_55468:576-908(+)
MSTCHAGTCPGKHGGEQARGQSQEGRLELRNDPTKPTWAAQRLTHAYQRGFANTRHQCRQHGPPNPREKDGGSMCTTADGLGSTAENPITRSHQQGSGGMKEGTTPQKLT